MKIRTIFCTLAMLAVVLGAGMWAVQPLAAAPARAAKLRQLTQGGCCTQPSWTADGRRVMFIDKPAPNAAVGIWGVDVSGGAPQLVTTRLASYTPDMAYLVDTTRGTTVVERVADGTRWTIAAADGRSVSLSPGRKRIAWSASSGTNSRIWVANLDGSDAKVVATLMRGGFSGWISDDVLLLNRRTSSQSVTQILSTFSLTSGVSTELLRADRLGGTVLSPDGRWLAYTITLTPDAAQNGLWVMRTDGGGRRKLDPSLFGAYQWRSGNQLLVLPLRPNAASHEVWEFDADAAVTRRLTDPASTPFKIANGDWRVSPDGRTIVFLSSSDYNLWLLELGEG
jgi:Tol biopolymer transport system component